MSQEQEIPAFQTSEVKEAVMWWIFAAEEGQFNGESGPRNNRFLIQLLRDAGAFDDIELSDELISALENDISAKALGALVLDVLYNASLEESAEFGDMSIGGVSARRTRLRKGNDVVRDAFYPEVEEPQEDHPELLLEMQTEITWEHEVAQAAVAVFSAAQSRNGFRLLQPQQQRTIAHSFAGTSFEVQAGGMRNASAVAAELSQALRDLVVHTFEAKPEGLSERHDGNELRARGRELMGHPRYEEFAEQLTSRDIFETFVRSDSMTLYELGHHFNIHQSHAQQAVTSSFGKLIKLASGEFTGTGGKLPLRSELRSLLAEDGAHDALKSLEPSDRQAYYIAQALGLSDAEARSLLGLKPARSNGRGVSRFHARLQAAMQEGEQAAAEPTIPGENPAGPEQPAESEEPRQDPDEEPTANESDPSPPLPETPEDPSVPSESQMSPAASAIYAAGERLRGSQPLSSEQVQPTDLHNEVGQYALYWILGAEEGQLDANPLKHNEQLVALLEEVGAFDGYEVDDAIRAGLANLSPRLLATLVLDVVYGASLDESAELAGVKPNTIGIRRVELHHRYGDVSETFYPSDSPVDDDPSALLEMKTNIEWERQVPAVAAAVFSTVRTHAGFRLLSPDQQKRIVLSFAGYSFQSQAADGQNPAAVAVELGQAIEELAVKTFEAKPDPITDKPKNDELRERGREIRRHPRYEEFAEQIKGRKIFELFVDSDDIGFPDIGAQMHVHRSQARRTYVFALRKLIKLARGEYADTGTLPILHESRSLLSNPDTYKGLVALESEDDRTWYIARTLGMSMSEAKDLLGLENIYKADSTILTDEQMQQFLVSGEVPKRGRLVTVRTRRKKDQDTGQDTVGVEEAVPGEQKKDHEIAPAGSETDQGSESEGELLEMVSGDVVIVNRGPDNVVQGDPTAQIDNKGGSDVDSEQAGVEPTPDTDDLEPSNGNLPDEGESGSEDDDASDGTEGAPDGNPDEEESNPDTGEGDSESTTEPGPEIPELQEAIDAVDPQSIPELAQRLSPATALAIRSLIANPDIDDPLELFPNAGLTTSEVTTIAVTAAAELLDAASGAIPAQDELGMSHEMAGYTIRQVVEAMQLDRTEMRELLSDLSADQATIVRRALRGVSLLPPKPEDHYDDTEDHGPEAHDEEIAQTIDNLRVTYRELMGDDEII